MEALEILQSYLEAKAASSPFTGRTSGCTDAFSIFGFLAFLLGLLTLLGNNTGMMMAKRRRRRRSLDWDELVQCWGRSSSAPDLVSEGLASSQRLLEGFLGALGSSTPECSALTLCSAAAEAAALGDVGSAFAEASGAAAHSWLSRSDPALHRLAAAAVETGRRLGRQTGGCSAKYACNQTGSNEEDSARG